jgi:hypothetical protein
MELKAYGEFENKVDNNFKDIQGTKISALALRAVLSLFNYNIHTKFFAENNLSDKSASHPSLFFYLLPFLNQCDKSDINSSALEAANTVTNSFKDDFLTIYLALINYAGFCEIAPYVWRGIYDIDLSNPDELRLTFSSENYESEMKDIVLISLSSAHSLDNLNYKKEPYNRQVLDYSLQGNIHYDLMNYEIKVSKKWFKEYFFDNHVVDDEVYIALGFTKQEFIEFQTFWMGLSKYYLKSSNAIKEYLAKSNNYTEIIQNELLNNTSPLIKRYDIYLQFNEKIIGLKEEKFFQIMDVFAFDVNKELKSSDGYYPVFFDFNGSYLFSPFNVITKLMPRNLIYLLIQNDKNSTLFDDKISHLMEPNLINHAIALFEKLPGANIQTNKNWKVKKVGKGEFDIAIYFPKDKVVLHIQAKGSIPPENARLTRNLESRMIEGSQQLERFKKIEPKEKDRILSVMFDIPINSDEVKVVDVLLGWSGFGTSKIYNIIKQNDIAPLNLSILYNYVLRYPKKKFDLNNFAKDINSITDRIIKKSKPIIATNTYTIGDKKIIYESIDHTARELLKYKYKAED